MAIDINTLAGLVQLNDKNNSDIDVSDLLQDAPLVARMAAVEASNGTNHSYLKETVAEGVAFRDVNAGVTNTNSQDEEVSIALKVLDGHFTVDTAMAKKYKDGPEAFLNKRVVRKLAAAFSTAEKQIIYGTGTGGSADGFAGLFENAALNQLADSMVVRPAVFGTTAASQSSVIMMRTGENDTAFVIGNDGVIEVDDPVIQQVVVDPGTDNTTYVAWVVNAIGWGGIQYGSAFSVGRICNIETSLTDDDMYNLFAQFPANRKPNLVSMNRSAQELLRKSRTAVNVTGKPADYEDNWQGIPLIVTDSLLTTEAIVA
ncbi:MAG: hypothetical protein GY820_39800 [Gammaproteobacteria bacterium]|nr:hypothetical protein [Gammaproteobacteria bacterium]